MSMENILHVSYAPKKNCYNFWDSAGMTCVHCGCCQKDKRKRLMARIKLHEKLLEKELAFDDWDDEIWHIQEINNRANIEWNKRKIAQLKRELRKMGEKEG